MARLSDPRRRFFLGILVLAATLLSLLAAEVSWGAVRHAGWAGSSPPLVEFDSELGWRNRRSVELRHRQADFDVMVQLDGAGHRITPGGSSDPPIVFLGDSIVFGWGVDSRDTFVSRVGRHLNRRTVNLGVAGYGTDQSYLALVDHNRQFPLRSALVIYVLTSNDVVEVAHGRMYGRPKARAHLDGTFDPLPSSRPPLGWIEQRSYLLASIRTWIDRLTHEPQSQSERTGAVRLVASLIERMQRRCEAAGADFLLVVPSREILEGRTPAGVQELDLGPAIDTLQRAGQSLLFKKDPHFNAAGHALVADEILARLAASPLRFRAD